MQATACAAVPVWSAMDLGNVGTEFLRSLNLRDCPPATARAIRAELAVRRDERRLAC